MTTRFAAFLLAAAALPTAAEEIDHAVAYRDCMALVERAPSEAFESALAWRGLGGGDPAEHCAAVALVRLGQHAEAARRLEGLAQRTRAGPAFRAGLLDQAARAYLLDGQAERAEAVLAAALALDQANPDRWIDRAEARAARGRWRDAIDDLDAAIARDPGRADAFVFRASARRMLGELAEALADAESALALAPAHVEGLLERGNIRRLMGDAAGARADWVAAVTAAPGSPAADAAQANLEKMDLRTD